MTDQRTHTHTHTRTHTHTQREIIVNHNFEITEAIDCCGFFGLFGCVLKALCGRHLQRTGVALCALVQFVWDLSIYSCGISFCPFQEMGEQRVSDVGVLL